MSRLDEMIREMCPAGVDYLPLSRVATIERGGNLQKKDLQDDGVPAVHYGQIYTRFGLFADRSFSFVSPSVAVKQRMAAPGAVVMAVTSETLEDVCSCVGWLGMEDIAVSGHTAIITPNPALITTKYLVYWFQSQEFRLMKRRLAHGTKVIEVTPSDLETIQIPIPPLPIQQEIVRILDTFTELVAELEAELEARKKQYE